MMYKNYLKRFFDFCLSLIGILVVSPILIIVTIMLTFSNKGKPFFFQTRPGLNEKLFKIIKFKTMKDTKDIDGKLLPDEKRLSKIGSFVRKTSIDELPQLINVLKNDMSLIGPRPLLPEYLPFYNKEQKKRHSVKPGITGWAQVNGRNAISWDLKFILDVYYVENYNFILDMKIVFLTIKKVLVREDISSKTSITMEEFKGSS